MKKLLYIALSLLIFSCNPETVSYTTGSESDVGGVLNGRVNSYSIKTFNATSKFGEPIKGNEKEVSIFDAFELKSKHFNEAGNEIESEMGTGFRYVYEFNEEGNKVGWSGFDKNELSVKWIYELDNQLNIIKSSSYDPDGSLNYYTRNLYNENGENYESIQYDDNGDLSRKTERIYGDSGNIDERIEYDKNEKISSKYTYTYDSISGNKIAQKYFNIKTYSGDTRTANRIYKYLIEDGEVTTPTFDRWWRNVKKGYSIDGKYLGGQEIQSNIFKYLSKDATPNHIKIPNDTGFDEWRKKVFPTPYKKLALENEITYDYNDKGDLILENKNGELKEYKYDYDEYENWIVKYEYLYGKIKYMTERNIQYYQ